MFDKVRFAALELLASKKGAAMAEYGLLVALVAVACIAAVTGLGTGLSNKFTSISNSL